MSDQEQLQELIANNSQGILAAVTRAGYPHLTNVLYVWDAADRMARVSTTAPRVKARILRRDPRAALHVPGAHFWSYAVAECDAEVSSVATTPGDETCQELLEVHSSFYGKIADQTAFFGQMIEAERRFRGPTTACRVIAYATQDSSAPTAPRYWSATRSAVLPRARTRLHRPDDAQAEPREAGVRRVAAAFFGRRAAGSPRAQPSCRGRPDDCMARMMRKPNRARSTSDAASLLLSDI